MQVKKPRYWCALAVASVACLPVRSQAAILGGDVTGGTTLGDFERLASPPTDAGPDTFDSPNLVAFDELQDIVLDVPFAVRPGLTLPTGSDVSSHYVVFDPAVGSSVQGFVDFDQPILAVIVTPVGLDASALEFGLPETNYITVAFIGPELEAADSVMISPGDAQRLMFSTAALTPGDHVRVLTGIVPEPRGLAMMTVGGCVLMATGICRRRQRLAAGRAA